MELKTYAVNKEIICISCPVGCRLTVTLAEESGVTVTGNLCNRGDSYGREEVLSPRRIVTAVVKTDSIIWPYVPVKTDGALPKEYIPELLEQIYSIKAKPPVRCGGIVIENFRETGINVVFTRSLPD